MQKLWGNEALGLSIIEFALRDLLDQDERVRHEAREYIFWSQDFCELADCLNIDYQAIREGAAERIRGNDYVDYDRRGRRKPARLDCDDVEGNRDC